MNPELQHHFLNLYSLALADSKFDEKEIAVLYRLGEERGIPKDKIDSMLLNPPNTEQLHLPETLEEKIEYLYDYAKMILADGIVHEEETNTLEKFCIKFHFEATNAPAIAQLLLEAAKDNISTTDLLTFVIQNN